METKLPDSFFPLRNSASNLIAVESPLMWIEHPEMVSKLPPSQIPGHATMIDYVKGILLKEASRKKVLEEEKRVGMDADFHLEIQFDHTDFTDFANLLNEATMNVYVGNLHEARKLLVTMKSKHKFINQLKEGQKEAVNYLIEALSWALNTFDWERNRMGKYDKGDPAMEAAARKLIVKFQKMIAMYRANRNRPATATFQFFKARFSQALYLSEELTWVLLEEATFEDPMCHEWFQHLGSLNRHIRRKKMNVGSESSESSVKPSEKELEAYEKSLDLAPNDSAAKVNLALAIKESFWDEGIKAWKHHEKDYLRCVDLFRSAIGIAKSNREAERSKAIRILLGEFLLFGKGSKLDQGEGKALLDEVHLEYQQCPVILHKLGKLHHNGSERTKQFRDANIAEILYRSSLDEAGGKNLDCLMDYLKFLKKQMHGLPNEDPNVSNFSNFMLQKLDDSLQVAKSDHDVIKLRILRGFVLWNYKPLAFLSGNYSLAATEEWVGTLKSFPEFQQEICKSITGPFLDDHQSRVNIRDLLEQLELLKMWPVIRDRDEKAWRAILILTDHLTQLNKKH